MRNLLILVLIFCSNSVVGQTKVGLQGGVLLSHINVNDEDIDGRFFANPKNIFGFKGGGYLELNLGKDFYLTPELNFVRKGGKISNTLTDGKQVVAYHFESITNNLELPLTLNYKLKIGGGSIFAGVGGVAEYLISEKNNESLASFTPLNIDELIQSGSNSNFIMGQAVQLKKINWGANFLVGYEFQFGMRAIIQARPDFSDRNENKKSTYKNFYGGLMLGYSF